MPAYYERGWHRKSKQFQSVWHQSENAVYGENDAEVTIAEAQDLAGMLGLHIDAMPIEAVMDDDTRVPLTNPQRFALMITAPWMEEPYFSGRLVGNRYVPMQIDELTAPLEALQKHWPLEGTMILRRGEIVIIQLAIDEFNVGNHDGEKHYSFLTAANDLVQGGVIWLRTNIRAQCWNTYSMSIKALEKLRIPHNADTETILAFIAEVEAATVESQKEHVADLEKLIERAITEKEFDGILHKTFPEPKKTSKMRLAEAAAADKVDSDVSADFFELVDQDKATVEWKTSRMEALRKAVRAAYEKFNEETPHAANTAYAAFQAVTWVVNHSPLFKGSDEKQAISLLFGQKAQIQDKAWEAVSKLK